MGVAELQQRLPRTKTDRAVTDNKTESLRNKSMEERIRISAVYNGGCTAAEGDAVLDLRPVCEQKTADALEYHAEVTNRSSETVVLETVRLLECSDPAVFGIGEGPYDIF